MDQEDFDQATCKMVNFIIWYPRTSDTGWWYTYPSEKYEIVSWDDDIPNWMENKIHVPNHQPGNFPIVHSHLQGLVQEIMALVKVLAALNSPDRPGCDRMGIMEDNGHVFFFLCHGQVTCGLWSSRDLHIWKKHTPFPMGITHVSTVSENDDRPLERRLMLSGPSCSLSCRTAPWAIWNVQSTPLWLNEVIIQSGAPVR